MKKHTHSLIAMLAGTLMASPSAFAYGEFNARLDCISKVTGWGSGYSNPSDIRVKETGHNSYVVAGKVEGRHDRDHRFTCRIEHKEVVSWKVGSGRDDDKSDKKALAVGAGIVGLAAIAAIAANNKDKDRDSAYDDNRNHYNSGRRNPFDDMDYLQSECKRMVRFHLNQDHGRVDNIEFRTADLDGRNLTGRGKVFFENDRRRKIDYRCSFDRAGNIHDGHYEYQYED